MLKRDKLQHTINKTFILATVFPKGLSPAKKLPIKGGSSLVCEIINTCRRQTYKSIVHLQVVLGAHLPKPSWHMETIPPICGSPCSDGGVRVVQVHDVKKVSSFSHSLWRRLCLEDFIHFLLTDVFHIFIAQGQLHGDLIFLICVVVWLDLRLPPLQDWGCAEWGDVLKRENGSLDWRNHI